MLCAVLALAGHAALLKLSQAPHGAPPASGNDAGSSLHVSLIHANPEPSASPLAPETSTAPAVSTTPLPAARNDTPGIAAEPALLEPLPEVSLPDAFLPDSGVQMRAFLRIGTDGHVLDIVTAVSPADVHPAYQGIGERALREARFELAARAHTQCLRLEFLPGTATAVWGWRPDTTAQRCLSNTAQSARALPNPP